MTVRHMERMPVYDGVHAPYLPEPAEARTFATPTLAELRTTGRDPLRIFRLDAALAIDPAWLARAAEGGPLGFWADSYDDSEDEDMPGQKPGTPYAVQNGVAVYTIEGPLTQRGYWCWQGYDSIARDLRKALADSSVRAVLLKVNSPGGHAAGVFEAVRQMRADVVASGKRVVAVADEMACSAAYAIACVADEIVVPEPAVVGSVGVISSLASYAKALDEQGVDVRVLVSGREKADGNPSLPISDAAEKRAQERVDALAGIFHRWVADRRRMSTDAVAALEAGVRMGATAVAAGLADRVQSVGEALAALQQYATTARPSRLAAKTHTTRNTNMDEALLAAIAAATGETDPAKQASALASLTSRVATADATITKLSVDVSTANERATQAEKRAETMERNAEIEAAKASGQWSASLNDFLSSLSVTQLRDWRAAAPRVVPSGEVKPPTETKAEKDLPTDIATLVAKATDGGWKSLTPAEKHTLSSHDKALADRLRGKR